MKAAKIARKTPRNVEVLRATLRALKERCPGVHTTDQVTGETFAALIDGALKYRGRS